MNPDNVPLILNIIAVAIHELMGGKCDRSQLRKSIGYAAGRLPNWFMFEDDQRADDIVVFDLLQSKDFLLRAMQGAVNGSTDSELVDILQRAAHHLNQAVTNG
jgi:hypothetical protein